MSKEDNSNTVKITGGSVEMKSFVDRKTAREYNQALFAGVEASPDEAPKIPLSQIETANEALVMSMSVSATVDGAEKKVDQNFIDELHAEDFATLAAFCTAKVTGNTAEKKS